MIMANTETKLQINKCDIEVRQATIPLSTPDNMNDCSEDLFVAL